MAEIRSKARFDQGVSTPEVSELERIILKNGFSASYSNELTVAPVSGACKVSIASGPTIRGTYLVKVTTSDGGFASATILVDASSQDSFRSVVNIVSITDNNNSTSCFFRSVVLRKRAASNDFAVVVDIRKTGVTSCVFNVTALAETATVVASDPETAFPTLVSANIVDVRATPTSSLYKYTGLSLTAFTKAGTYYSEASTGYPADASPNGTIIVMGSAFDGRLTQLYIDDNAKAYVRVSNTSRSFGGAVWSPLISGTAGQEIVDKANTNSMIWAIVFG